MDELEDLIYDQKSEEFLNIVEKRKDDIFSVDSSGSTLLHTAAKVENSDAIITRLVELGLNIHSKDEQGNTPLIIAANYGCTKNIKTIVKNGGDPMIRNDKLDTPLHVASWHGHFDTIQVLVELGTSIEGHPNNPKSPLVKALEGRRAQMEVMEFLLQNGANVNAGDGTASPLMVAIGNEDIEKVNYLLMHGADIDSTKNASGENALEYAKRVGNQEIIKLLNTYL